MVQVAAYRRPTTLAEALTLLEAPNAVPLAGGTRLVAQPSDEPLVVIDLQGLALTGIAPADATRLEIGSMTTLQELCESDLMPEVVRAAARRELPSTLRAAATLGGTIAAGDPDSELLAALLVHEAFVRLTGPDGQRDVWLEALLGDPGVLASRIITTVTIDPRGTAAAVRVGRTVADRPIVAAVARRTPAGNRLLALAGVARTPVLVGDLDDVRPIGDFRGSAEYRRSIAAVLADRALTGIA